MSASGNNHSVSALSAQIEASALGRTLSGIVRSELPTIETALQHGLRYEQLCQHFAALGVTVSPGTLRQTVYRLRRQQGRRGGDTRTPLLQRVPGQTPVTQTVPALNSATAVPANSPIAHEPGPIGDALCDRVPLLEVKPAEPTSRPADPFPPTDFITAIRQSSPDLDVLAYRYRQSQQRERGSSSQSGMTPSTKPAHPAVPNSPSLPPGSPSS